MNDRKPWFEPRKGDVFEARPRERTEVHTFLITDVRDDHVWFAEGYPGMEEAPYHTQDMPLSQFVDWSGYEDLRVVSPDEVPPARSSGMVSSTMPADGLRVRRGMLAGRVAHLYLRDEGLCWGILWDNGEFEGWYPGDRPRRVQAYYAWGRSLGVQDELASLTATDAHALVRQIRAMDATPDDQWETPRG